MKPHRRAVLFCVLAIAGALALGVSVACAGALPPDRGSAALAPGQVGRSALADQPGPAPSPAVLTPSPPPAPPTPAPRPPARSRPLYDAEVDLDYAAHTLSVREVIEYPNHSQETLDTIVLLVEANRQPGVFALREVAVDGQPPPQPPALDGAALRIGLPRPLLPDEEIRLALAYELRLPRLPGGAYNAQGAFGWTPRQTNLRDWLPLVAVREAGGWHEPVPSAMAEHARYEAADFSVAIGTTGGAQPAPTLMATGTAAPEGDRARYRLDESRVFAFSASTQMAAASATALGGAVRVESHYFPEHEVAGRAALRATVSALEVFSRLFGAYPYDSLLVIEADFLGGMEHCGAYHLGREYYAGYNGTPWNLLTTVSAHETAHQWWFCRVGNDEAAAPWLDEALATYSEFLYYEAAHPELAAGWWDFRINRRQPRGWVDSSVYEIGDHGQYLDAVYLRGALLFRDVRAAMGAAPFLAALQEYATAYGGKIATGPQLWETLERHSPTPLAPVRARYVRT